MDANSARMCRSQGSRFMTMTMAIDYFLSQVFHHHRPRSPPCIFLSFPFISLTYHERHQVQPYDTTCSSSSTTSSPPPYISLQDNKIQLSVNASSSSGRASQSGHQRLPSLNRCLRHDLCSLPTHRTDPTRTPRLSQVRVPRSMAEPPATTTLQAALPLHTPFVPLCEERERGVRHITQMQEP
jgi:hypothetical protein